MVVVVYTKRSFHGYLGSLSVRNSRGNSPSGFLPFSRYSLWIPFAARYPLQRQDLSAKSPPIFWVSAKTAPPKNLNFGIILAPRSWRCKGYRVAKGIHNEYRGSRVEDLFTAQGFFEPPIRLMFLQAMIDPLHPTEPPLHHQHWKGRPTANGSHTHTLPRTTGTTTTKNERVVSHTRHHLYTAVTPLGAQKSR